MWSGVSQVQLWLLPRPRPQSEELRIQAHTDCCKLNWRVISSLAHLNQNSFAKKGVLACVQTEEPNTVRRDFYNLWYFAEKWTLLNDADKPRDLAVPWDFYNLWYWPKMDFTEWRRRTTRLRGAAGFYNLWYFTENGLCWIAPKSHHSPILKSGCSLRASQCSKTRAKFLLRPQDANERHPWASGLFLCLCPHSWEMCQEKDFHQALFRLKLFFLGRSIGSNLWVSGVTMAQMDDPGSLEPPAAWDTLESIGSLSATCFFMKRERQRRNFDAKRGKLRRWTSDFYFWRFTCLFWLKRASKRRTFTLWKNTSHLTSLLSLTQKRVAVQSRWGKHDSNVLESRRFLSCWAVFVWFALSLRKWKRKRYL